MPTDLKKLCILLYGIFAAGAAMQFSFWTVILGSLALLAAVSIAYVRRKSAAGTVYESHFTWLIRTFWIGGGVYLPVLTVVESIILFSKIDTNMVMEKVASGEIVDPAGMQAFFMTHYGDLTLRLTLAFTLPFLAWWLWRCWKGYRALKADQPVENPMSWF